MDITVCRIENVTFYQYGFLVYCLCVNRLGFIIHLFTVDSCLETEARDYGD